MSIFFHRVFYVIQTNYFIATKIILVESIHTILLVLIFAHFLGLEEAKEKLQGNMFNLILKKPNDLYFNFCNYK